MGGPLKKTFLKKTGESDVSRASVLSCSADKYNDGGDSQKYFLSGLSIIKRTRVLPFENFCQGATVYKLNLTIFLN